MQKLIVFALLLLSAACNDMYMESKPDQVNDSASPSETIKLLNRINFYAAALT
jgi:hypothetical protein